MLRNKQTSLGISTVPWLQSSDDFFRLSVSRKKFSFFLSFFLFFFFSWHIPKFTVQRRWQENIDRTWGAFEFERAVWNSLGEWKYFIWKANSDDVRRGVFNKYSWYWESPPTKTVLWLDRHWWCDHSMRHTLVMSSLYVFWSWSVYTNFPAVLTKNKARQVRSMIKQHHTCILEAYYYLSVYNFKLALSSEYKNSSSLIQFCHCA